MKNMTPLLKTVKATTWHAMPGRGYAIDSINGQLESLFIRVREGCDG
jgi:hypothetical protein